MSGIGNLYSDPCIPFKALAQGLELEQVPVEMAEAVPAEETSEYLELVHMI